MNRDEMILAEVSGALVFHLGCSDWPYTIRRLQEGRLLHESLIRISKECVGVDLNDERLEPLRDAFPENKFKTFDEMGEIAGGAIVLAGDVIEHVENPGYFLESIASKASTGTKLLITTPNAQSFKQAVRAILGREEQHPDHVVLFSLFTLTELASRYGWELMSARFYNSRTRSRSLFKQVIRKLVEKPVSFLGNGRGSDGLFVIFRKK